MACTIRAGLLYCKTPLFAFALFRPPIIVSLRYQKASASF
jgi:hypothetical protein